MTHENNCRLHGENIAALCKAVIDIFKRVYCENLSKARNPPAIMGLYKPTGNVSNVKWG
jgi:hypothetical protein